MGRNFYRAVKTNQNSKSRNRQQVVQSNRPPPPVAPVKPITIEQFLYYDADDNGVLTQSEITSNPTGNFDLIKAAELMRLSIFAYDQYDKFKVDDVNPWEIPPPFDTLYKNPVTVINAIYENVADAFGASDPISTPSIPLGFITESIASNDIFVNWRGTGNTAEWKQDAKFNQTPCSFLPQVPQKEMVHLGFQELYTTPTTNPNPSGILSPQNTVMNYLNAVTQKQNKIVHVTGHSLGGALAVLNTCDILANISGFKSVIMYNFAGPRAGDVDFVDTFNAKTLINGTPGCWRVVNDYDLVPMLPIEEQGYKHVNGLYSIKFGNKLTPTNLADIPLNHSHLTYFVTLVQELRNNKYTAAYLKSKGFTATELKSGGYTRIELQAAGFTDAVLNALPW